MSICVLVATLACFCAGEQLPTTFKKCDWSKADLNDCLKVAIQDALPLLAGGIPEIGLPSLEPLEIPIFELEAGDGPTKVDQKYTNMKVDGYSKMRVDTVELDLEKKTLLIAGTFPERKEVADFEVEGAVLGLSVKGEGTSTVTYYGAKMSTEFVLEEYEIGSSQYFKVVGCKIKYEPTSMRFHYENLFDGDEELGDSINNLINEHWREVFGDVLTSYERSFCVVHTAIANGFFSKVPVSELFETA